MAKDSSVYVDASALSSWSTQMSSINQQAIDDLKSFISLVDNLDSSWAGNSAEAFLRETNKFVESALVMHNKMIDVEKFLNEVIMTVEQQ